MSSHEPAEEAEARPMPRQERLDARPEVEEVAPGVLRAQIPIMLPGLGHVNCYVLEDSAGATLIDPGLPDPDSHKVLLKRLSSAGIPPERVHTVLVTHSHPDHFGGAGRLRAEHSCEVLAHESFSTPFDPQPVDMDLVELQSSGNGSSEIATELTGFELDEVAEADLADLADLEGPLNRGLAQVLFGTGPIGTFIPRRTPYGEEGFRPAEGELEWMRSWDRLSKQGLLSLAPTRRIPDGAIVRLGDRDWQAMHTPGHTGDHLCLFDPVDGTLLSGDHVLPTITPHISGLTSAEDALSDFFAALRRVAALDGVRTVLPAHGLPFDDLPGRVEQIIEHHDRRLGELEAIGVRLGTAGVRSYSRELFQERSWGPMAESETYAHLEHLRLLGRMRRSTDTDGKAVYTLDTDSEPHV